ncbi:TrmH family RNA methyltransferase [Jonesia quinghaiensis]|uniref:TrmH family RNA methyltransferase n=1 Tax=Jonesia quinghaiensis TaxID=262806 RepID=UPI0003F658B5|nr:RNA methyltransferase [Jonesia quinghaiensis]
MDHVHEPIIDLADPRLEEYTNLTDLKLRSRYEPEKGLYIAESATVIERALNAGHRPRSFFMSARWVEQMEPITSQFPDVPTFVGEPATLETITGFNVHRGALAAMHRPQLLSVAELLDQVAHRRAHSNLGEGLGPQGTRARSRIAVLDGIIDHTNIGAIIRSCAALGVDAIIVTDASADPLYRRAIRVSMGTVFQVPWTRSQRLDTTMRLLGEAGYTTAALALNDNSITLDDLIAENHDHLAFLFGNEGHGLPAQALRDVDRVVRIPMAGEVDSLNVAATSALVFYATR